MKALALTGPEPRSIETTGEGELVELCAFQVGEEEYAIDLRRVREIVQPLPVTPVPCGPEFLDGVMDLRGEVIPVVDVRRRLGFPVRGAARAKVLVVNVAGRVLGLVVDAVLEVMRLPRASIGPPPLGGGVGPRLYLGICAPRERGAGAGRATARKLRLLLNVKALLEPGVAGEAAAQRPRPGRPDPA